jgi:hypothetical protein
MSLSQIDRIAEQNRIDTALFIKNDRMGRNARPRVNVVKKNITGIDEELLKEYQQIKPNTYEFTDPSTGETKYRKYQLPDAEPELIPDLEYIPNKELEDELDRIDEIQKDYVREYEVLKAEIVRMNEIVKELKNEIDNGKKKSRNQSRSINNELRLALERLDELKQKLPRLEKGISDGDIEKQRVKDFVSQSNTESQKIKKTNLDRINMYRDELNFLNKGSFSTEKADNESEMEYLERLQANAQILSPEDELIDAKFATISRFREKMRELVKDPVLIEQVINSLDSNSDDNVDQKAELLKNWNLLKTKFISTYGVNNRRIKVDDIITFFDFFLQGASGADLPEAIKGNITKENLVKAETQLNNVDVEPIPTENTLLLIHHTATGDKLLFLRSVAEGSDLHLIYSFDGNVGTFKEFFDKDIPSNRKTSKAVSMSSKEIENRTGISASMLNEVFGIKTKSVNPSVLARKITEKWGIPAIYAVSNSQVERRPYSLLKGTTKNRIEYGMGLEEIPQYAEFGNVFILLKKLYYDNILSVRDKNMKSIAGLKTAKVSEPLVSIIMGMSKGLQPTFGDINALSSPERQLYDRLVRIANLNKSVPHQGDKSVAELKKRLSLVEGELEMGNDNYALQQEIHTILNSLHQLKAITKGQKDKYLKQFA